MSVCTTALDTLPKELLDAIAFALVIAHDTNAHFDPVDTLTPLLQTSKHFYNSLAPCFPASHALWRRVFRAVFDYSAVARRAFNPKSEDYRDQLVLYCRTLAVISRGDIHHMDAPDALCVAYIMLLENDGNNRKRLEAAGVYNFVRAWFFANYSVGRDEQDGWPRDSEWATCALWVMWMLTTPARLFAESSMEREQMVAHLLPFVLVPYRYTTAEAPPSYFTIPLPPSASAPSNQDHPFLTTSIPTAHGMYPVERQNEPHNQFHFGSRPNLNYPPIANAAKLLYFSRRDLIPLPIAPHFHPTRAAADAAGIRDVGPTVEDMHEVNTGSSVRFPSLETGGRPLSRRWDADWHRARQCNDYRRPNRPRMKSRNGGRGRLPGSTYESGTLDGLWQGRLLFPNNFILEQILNNPNLPDGGVTEQLLWLVTKPFFVRFQEHHMFYPGEPIPSYTNRVPTPTPNTILPPPNENMKNGWFAHPPTHPPTANPASSHFHLPAQHAHGLTTTFRLESERGYLRIGFRAGSQSIGEEYVYKTFKRQHARQPEEDKRQHGIGLGEDGCAECKARDKWEEEKEAQNLAALAEIHSRHYPQEADADEEGDEEMSLTENDEAQFSSVGLGREANSPTQDEDEDEDDDMDDADSMQDDFDMNADSDGDAGVLDRRTGEVHSGIRPTYDDDEDDDDFGLNYPEDDDMNGGEGDGSHLHRLRRRRHVPSPQDPKLKFKTPRARRTATCTGIRDIVITGTTDYKHARAWGDYVYFGRVRMWDGLIGILRRSRAGLGDVFMYGYVVGGGDEVDLDLAVSLGVGMGAPATPAGGPSQGGEQKTMGSPGWFVGNWRTLSDNPNHPPYESAFVMSRRA